MNRLLTDKETSLLKTKQNLKNSHTYGITVLEQVHQAIFII